MNTLTWTELRALGSTDNANRWFPNESIAEYFVGYRAPSRSWPYSYAKAAMTKKFRRWLAANRPEMAV